MAAVLNQVGRLGEAKKGTMHTHNAVYRWAINYWPGVITYINWQTKFKRNSWTNNKQRTSLLRELLTQTVTVITLFAI